MASVAQMYSVFRSVYTMRRPHWPHRPHQPVYEPRTSHAGRTSRVLYAELGWLFCLVAKALDLQLTDCEFNSRPQHCRVTTLGKLFTPMCLSRSQWFSDGMIDCGVRGCGQLCLSRQPLQCTALVTGCASFLQCLGRLSLPRSVDGKMSISFQAE